MWDPSRQNPIFSAGAEQLAVAAYVPEARQGECDCKDWLATVLALHFRRARKRVGCHSSEAGSAIEWIARARASGTSKGQRKGPRKSKAPAQVASPPLHVLRRRAAKTHLAQLRVVVVTVHF